MAFKVDITAAFDALKSLEDWHNVKGEDILKFVSKQKYNYRVQDFTEHFCVEDAVIMRGDLNLVSLHVTTNNDRCEKIKKYGLMNLQDTINSDTPLGNYLRDQGIKIDLAKKIIEYKGELFSIEEKDEKFHVSPNPHKIHTSVRYTGRNK